MPDPRQALAVPWRRAKRLPGFVLEVIRSGYLKVAANGACEIFRKNGWLGIQRRLQEFLDDRHHYMFPDYPDWIARAERRLSVPDATAIPQVPALISVLLPTYNPDPRFLREAIESVRRQTFPRWELCIADDQSTDPRIRLLLADYTRQEPRIRLCLRDKNGHISAASNSALEMATGDFVALLDHDDILPDDALLSIALEIDACPTAVIVFSDEDKITAEGKRFGPVFKPDWDPDLMLQRNFVSHLGVYRTAAVRAVGGFRIGFEGSQDWDLTLRVAEICRAEDIRHIPRILYHWRAIPGSTALHLNEKNYAINAGLRAVEDHVRRCNIPMHLASSSSGPFWALTAKSHATPRASIILLPAPADHSHRIEEAMAMLRNATDYSNCEFLTRSNAAKGATDRIMDLPAAPGEVLCFISPFLQPNASSWLSELSAHAMRPEVGAVGARVVNDEQQIIHAGYRLDMEKVGSRLYAGATEYHRGYMDLAQLVQTLAAVGGGCLVVSREKFVDAGGFASSDLPDAFADIDLCLRLSARGLRNVWIPHVTLTRLAGTDVHATSVQTHAMRQRWEQRLAADPAANPNLALENNHPSLRYI